MDEGIRSARLLLDLPGNWAAVESLARELLKKETLTGRQAAEIMRKAGLV